MTLTGKGMFIWKIRWAEQGDALAIAQAALDAGLKHVLIKIADGTSRYNLHPIWRTDLVPPVVALLRQIGVEVWGWHYVYGGDPAGEARTAGRRMRELGLSGYVIDAEQEYKRPGMKSAASTYLKQLRQELPSGCPVALSSYRYPKVHPEFPWMTFLPAVDLVMPQVYWAKATNPAQQLQRCLREYRALTDLPIVATGAAYHEHGWTARPVEIVEFYQATRALQLPAFNFWEWNQARIYGLWDTIAGLEKYPGAPKPTRARSIVRGLRIRTAPSTQSSIVGALLNGEMVSVLDIQESGGETWCRHDRGWSCMQQPGKPALMEIVHA